MTSKHIRDTGLRFDCDQLLVILNSFIDAPEFEQGVRLFVTHPKGNRILFTKNASTYDQINKSFPTDYPDDLVIGEDFLGTYLETVVALVSQYFIGNNLLMGRVRVLKLTPRQGLDLHVDANVTRYHIPIATTKEAIFINDGIIGSMPILGALYQYDTSTLHAAINTSRDSTRVHLVFDVQ